MQITVSGKQVDLSDALRTRVTTHLETIAGKYFEHALEAVAEAEAADEHCRICAPAQPAARQLGEHQLGSRRGRAHELAAVELQKIFAVVLVQREP